ncbi:hypothetical protein [Companilactobacillus tucceti]|nr:hypothetical protein [Companilactobacillus tucceti]
MRHKSYLLMFISLLFLFFVAGCNNNSSHDLNENNSSGNIVIKGHNFRGLHQGNGTVKDPDYKYSMYFDKDGSFVQDIISSKGFSGIFTEEGTYTIDKNGDVTMNIDRVTEERFNDDSDLKRGVAPVSIVQRQGDTLNEAEDHLIKIENKKSYLLGTVNNVKLYPTNNQTVSYGKHYRREMKKYDNTNNKFSDHGFSSNGMDTPMNAIAFKGNKFIWRYVYLGKNADKDNAVMAVFQGTYSYNSKNKVVTLKIADQSNSYYGNLMKLNGFSYIKSGSPLAGSKLKLRYIDNSLLFISNKFKSWKMEDNYPDDSTQSQPKYEDYINSYSVATFNSQMHKEDTEKSSVKSKFPTKEDFANWVTDYYQNERDEPDFKVNDLSEGGRVSVRDSLDGDQTEKSVVYGLSYSITTDDSDVPDIGRAVCITSDGKIYSGHFNVLDDDLTQAYSDYSND